MRPLPPSSPRCSATWVFGRRLPYFAVRSLFPVISKRKLINTIFILSFPWYGYGAYTWLTKGFAEGMFTCALPFLLILFIHVLNWSYGQAPPIRVNRKFLWVIAALASIGASLPLGLYYKSPVIRPLNSTILVVLFFAPFLSAVVVQAYNQAIKGFSLTRLVLAGLLGYLLFNLAGMAAGMHNKLHFFPGRASPPFAMGIYDTAHILSMLNLMLLFEFRNFKENPLRWLALGAIYMVALAIMLSINSRLSFMIFLVFTVLFVTRAMKVLRGLFTVSLFTMPIMMTFGLLIYEILSLPVFKAVLERVDKQDVVTFNGRTYIWGSALDWFLDDRRGFLFGNGYNGQYRLRLLDWVAKLWGERGSYNLHMHSAFLEFLIDQGIVGIVLMYGVYWMGYKYYRHEYMGNTALAPLYAVFIYMMFAWQIDIVGYGIYSGFVIVFILMAPVVMKSQADEMDELPALQGSGDGGR